MGVWKKSPRADSAAVAALQAEIDALPEVQAFQAGYGSPNDPWTRGQGGRVQDPNQLRNVIRQRLGSRLPDGYDVSQDGQIVYTNKTPALQQAAWAALPIAGPMAAQALIGAAVPAGAAGFTGATALKYGLQYGVPLAGQLIGGKIAADADRDSNRALMDYYNRALDAEREERDYRRGFDEEGRRYGREFGEEGRRYGRYGDEYTRLSDEEKLRYGRTRDDYSRLSDEEKLAYGRSEDIRDRNYGYQQYGNFVETLEPYRAGGSAAASRMSQLMGGPATKDTGSYLNLANTARASVRDVPSVPNRPTWNYTPNRPTWNYPGGGQTGAGAGGAGDADPQVRRLEVAPPVSTTQPVGGGPQLILVEAPTGERRMVTAEQAASFERLGARRLS